MEDKLEVLLIRKYNLKTNLRELHRQLAEVEGLIAKANGTEYVDSISDANIISEGNS